MTARVLVIRADQSVTVETVDGLNGLQSLAGGWIENLPCPCLGVVAYVNENRAQPENPRGTRWWHELWIAAGRGADAAATIHGPVLVLGHDGHGNETDCPARVLTAFGLTHLTTGV